MLYRGFEITTVKAISKKTGKEVEAYKVLNKIVANIQKAKREIDLYRLCNIKSIDCK